MGFRRRTRLVAPVIHPLCDNLLHSDFPHQQAESRPLWADIDDGRRSTSSSASLLIVLNLAAGAVGGVAWFRNRPSIPFWYLLRAAQVAVFLQALLGGLLVVTDHEARRKTSTTSTGSCPCSSPSSPRAPAPAPPSASSATSTSNPCPADDQESLALAIVRREMGIMAVSCGVIFFLALRAAGTSGL